jgi:kynurenine formamidase
MNHSETLAQLVGGIMTGGIRVIDLTVPLQADTPVIKLPPRERDILGVGVETVGTDAGQAATFNPMFPCHTIMHGSNRFGLASLTNLDHLPPTGAVVIAPPLKIVNGSGSPLRVLALAPV